MVGVEVVDAVKDSGMAALSDDSVFGPEVVSAARPLLRSMFSY